MKFRYKKYGPGILRPVIPIEVIKNDLEVHYEVLVDSGADLCKVGGLAYKIEVGFMSMKGSAYGIVGQKGFFDKFVVKFDLQKEDIEIKPR